MEEDWFFYMLTLITFAVIFLFCYIRHKFTFFEKNKIASASNPSFPFGNVYDVMTKSTAFSMKLWKYHKRFKKKRCEVGGFYLFLNPALLLVEPGIEAERGCWREIQTGVTTNCDLDDKTFLREIFSNFGNWASPASISANFVAEEVNFGNLMDLYVVEIAESQFLGVKSEDLVRQIRESNNFWNFLKAVGIWPVFTMTSVHKSKRVYEEILRGIVREEKKRRNTNTIEKLLERNLALDKIVNIVFSLIYNLQISVNLLTLTLYELSLNDEIQEELRGEILRFKKNCTIADLEDLNKLSYLETVICETLRKYPVQPFTCHVCIKNFEKRNLKFSKDILLFSSIFGIHHDSDNYINPELFDPDRFSEENRKFIDPSKYRPFGIGNQDDFESRYITMVMKLILIELVTKFKFSLGKKSSRGLTFEESVFELETKDEMWFKMEKC